MIYIVYTMYFSATVSNLNMSTFILCLEHDVMLGSTLWLFINNYVIVISQSELTGLTCVIKRMWFASQIYIENFWDIAFKETNCREFSYVFTFLSLHAPFNLLDVQKG